MAGPKDGHDATLHYVNEVYPSFVRGTKGKSWLEVSYAFSIMNYVSFDARQPDQLMYDPYAHLRWNGDLLEPNLYYNRVLQLASMELTHQLMGLSLKDLWEMDLADFTRVEKHIVKLAEERKTQFAQLQAKNKELEESLAQHRKHQ